MIDIRPLKLIHLLFCFSIVAFAMVTCFLNKNLFVFDFTLSHLDTNTNIMSFIAVVFTVLAMNLGSFLFNSLIKKIDSSSSLQEKFAKYQAAFLIKCVLLEAASIFSIVMCLRTYNLYFMLVAAFSLIALWLIKPTKDRVFTTLQIQDTNLY